MSKTTTFIFSLFFLAAAFSSLRFSGLIQAESVPADRAIQTPAATEEKLLASKKNTESDNILPSDPKTIPDEENGSAILESAGFFPPMDRAGERTVKKTFGMFVTPETSPVQPDRFRGFHAGTDWEVFPDELEKEVIVRAICSGPLKLKKNASGYGGVAVQECRLNGAPITVVYGHLRLGSVTAVPGNNLEAGGIVGVLGADRSSETDGTRKHLHLGIHRGKSIDIRGYVDTAEKLSAWIDPCLYVCR